MRSGTRIPAAASLRGALLLLLACVPLLGGCGVYSATSGRIDPSIRRVAVEFFENRTSEADLGIELAELVIAALQADNTLRVVDYESADSVIEGTVTRYHLRQASISAQQQVDEFQVQIALELSFRVKATNSFLFERRTFSGVGNFFLDESDGTTEATARREAAVEIVKNVLAQVVEDW